MSEDAVGKALREAGRQFCICDGECFETRHGMMNGPCEARIGQAAAAVVAFLRALPDWCVFQEFGKPPVPGTTGSGNISDLADAVTRAASEDKT